MDYTLIRTGSMVKAYRSFYSRGKKRIHNSELIFIVTDVHSDLQNNEIDKITSFAENNFGKKVKKQFPVPTIKLG